MRRRKEKVAAQAGTDVKKMLMCIKAERPEAWRLTCPCLPGSSSPCNSGGQPSVTAVHKPAGKPKLFYWYLKTPQLKLPKVMQQSPKLYLNQCNKSVQVFNVLIETISFKELEPCDFLVKIKVWFEALQIPGKRKILLGQNGLPLLVFFPSTLELLTSLLPNMRIHYAF